MRIYQSPFGHVSYCLAKTKADLKKARKHFKLASDSLETMDTAACTHICKNKHGHVVCVIDMTNSKIGKQDYLALIVHECMHVWQEIKERMYENNPSIEFEAYSMQRIFRDVIS